MTLNEYNHSKNHSAMGYSIQNCPVCRAQGMGVTVQTTEGNILNLVTQTDVLKIVVLTVLAELLIKPLVKSVIGINS